MIEVLLDYFLLAFYISFYGLFFSWIFCKIRTMKLVKKLNCKDKYRKIKESLQDGKIYIIGSDIIIGGWAIIILYLIGALFLIGIMLFLILITLGGTAFIDTGADSTWYDIIMGGIYLYLSAFKLGGYVVIFFYASMEALFCYRYLLKHYLLQKNRRRKKFINGGKACLDISKVL